MPLQKSKVDNQKTSSDLNNNMTTAKVYTEMLSVQFIVDYFNLSISTLTIIQKLISENRILMLDRTGSAFH